MLRAGLFAIGVVLGAAALGGLLGLVGELLLATRPVVAAAVTASTATLVLAREVGRAPIPIPQRRWQVPRRWLGRFWMGAFVFGAVMGVGLFTFIPSLVFYLYLLTCLMVGGPGYGAAVGIVYGLVFAGTVWLRTAVRGPASPAGYAGRGIGTSSRAGFVGAALAPLALSLPLAWPF